MKQAGILSLLQIIQVFGCNDDREVSNLLGENWKHYFHYEFFAIPEVGQVLVWRVSEYVENEVWQLKYHTADFKTFQSREAYLIFTQKTTKCYIVHYWLGKDSPLEAKVAVAKYAVILYSLIFKLRIYEELHHDKSETIYKYRFATIRKQRPHAHLSREFETMESELFYHTMESTSPKMLHLPRVYTMLLTKTPNLYVVHGKEDTNRIKKVPLAIGLNWMRTNSCLVLVAGYDISDLHPIIAYCAPQASQMTINRAQNFSFKSLQYLNHHRQQPTNRDEHNLWPMFVTGMSHYNFKTLIEILEDRDLYKFYEVDKSDDHLKDADEFIEERDKTLTLIQISEYEKTIINPKYTQIYLSGFEDKCYLLDTNSVAGIFLLIGENSKMELTTQAIEYAEEYLDEKASFLKTPVLMRITLKGLPLTHQTIDFNIHLNTWVIRANHRDD